jgi:hypothetical protein
VFPVSSSSKHKKAAYFKRRFSKNKDGPFPMKRDDDGVSFFQKAECEKFWQLFLSSLIFSIEAY